MSKSPLGFEFCRLSSPAQAHAHRLWFTETQRGPSWLLLWLSPRRPCPVWALRGLSQLWSYVAMTAVLSCDVPGRGLWASVWLFYLLKAQLPRLSPQPPPLLWRSRSGRRVPSLPWGGSVWVLFSPLSPLPSVVGKEEVFRGWRPSGNSLSVTRVTEIVASRGGAQSIWWLGRSRCVPSLPTGPWPRLPDAGRGQHPQPGLCVRAQPGPS